MVFPMIFSMIFTAHLTTSENKTAERKSLISSLLSRCSSVSFFLFLLIIKTSKVVSLFLYTTPEVYTNFRIDSQKIGSVILSVLFSDNGIFIVKSVIGAGIVWFIEKPVHLVFVKIYLAGITLQFFIINVVHTAVAGSEARLFLLAHISITCFSTSLTCTSALKSLPISSSDTSENS